MIDGMRGKNDFVKRCKRIPVDKKHSELQITNGNILLTCIGPLCQAKTSFDAVNEMRDDPGFYMDALGIAGRKTGLVYRKAQSARPGNKGRMAHKG